MAWSLQNPSNLSSESVFLKVTLWLPQRAHFGFFLQLRVDNKSFFFKYTFFTKIYYVFFIFTSKFHFSTILLQSFFFVPNINFRPQFRQYCLHRLETNTIKFLNKFRVRKVTFNSLIWLSHQLLLKQKQKPIHFPMGQFETQNPVPILGVRMCYFS